MTNLKKRWFLWKAITSLSVVVVGCVPLRKRSLKEVIQWHGTLILPEPMTWKVCYDFQKSIMNIEGLNKVEKKMKNDNRILSKKILFNGKRISWIFIFRSSKDFTEWNKLTSQYVSEKMLRSKQYIQAVKKNSYIV